MPTPSSVPPSTPDTPRHPRRRAWLPPPVVLLCLLFYGLTTSGRLGTWDADLYFTVTERLVTEGQLDVPHSMILSHEEWKGRGGLYYAPFDLGQSIANIPFYLTGRLAARVVAGGRSPAFQDLIVRGTVASGNVIFTALTVWVVWAIAGELGWRRRGQTGAALLFGLGTLAWPYSAIGFNQALAALGQTVGLWGSLRFIRTLSPRDALLAGAGAGLGMAVRLNVILAVPWFALAMGWAALQAMRARPSASESRSKPASLSVPQSPSVSRPDIPSPSRSLSSFLPSAAAFLIPIALSILLALFYNWLRFGRLFQTGYKGDSNADFGLQNIPGQILALLVSPSKGVVFYAPIALLGVLGAVVLWRRSPGAPESRLPRLLARLSAGIGLTYLFFFSAMAYGHSGLHSWGPRFFVPLMPLIGLLGWAGYEAIRPRRWGEIFGKSLVAVSIVIQFLAVFSDQGERIGSLSQRLGGTEFYEETFFTFRGNPIVDRAGSVGEKAARLLYGPPTEAPPRLGSRSRPSEKNLVLAFPAYPNFWWAYAAAMGLLPRGALIAFVIAALAGIVVLARAARGEMARFPDEPEGP